MSDPWELRPFDSARDPAQVERMWRAGLDELWPLPAAAAEVCHSGLVAVDARGEVIGFVGVDSAGGVPLVLVAPDRRREGVGAALVAAAVARLAALGVREVRAGSGGEHHIWPGVPENLPGAVAFFTAQGWSDDHTTEDLTQDLRGYRTPKDVRDRIAASAMTIRVAGAGDLERVLAFEAAAFPHWLRHFELAAHEILLAEGAGGEILGTLLFGGPKPVTRYGDLLGPRAGEIACVGVGPQARGHGAGTALVAGASEILGERGTRVCLIDWTERSEFYARLGYRRWRGHHMFRRTIS